MRNASLAIYLCLFAAPAPAAAQQIKLPAEITDEAALPRVMPRFAKAVIAFQQAAEPAGPAEASLFRAQLVAGLYREALASLERLRAPLTDDPSPRIRARYLDYVLYARSRLAAEQRKTAFQAAYRETFHAVINPLDNRTAAMATNGLSFDNLSQASQALEQDLRQLDGKTAISAAESLKLISDYNEREVYRAFGSTSNALITEDDAHRYSVRKDVIVAMPDGGTVCALIVRPLVKAKLPALLQFTIYNDPGSLFREARRAASNGYVGVMGLTRGKGCSAGEIVPYEQMAPMRPHWSTGSPPSRGAMARWACMAAAIADLLHGLPRSINPRGSSPSWSVLPSLQGSTCLRKEMSSGTLFIRGLFTPSRTRR